MEKRNLIYLATIENIVILYQQLVNTFGVIFFYQLFNQNIFLALLPLGIGYIYYACGVNFTTALAGKLGTKPTLFIAFTLFALSSIPIVLYNYSRVPSWAWVWIFVFYTAKLMYHPSTIYLFGKNTNHINRGSQFSLVQITYILTKVTTPILGGLLSVVFDLSSIYIVGSLIVILAFIPAFKLQNYQFEVKVDFKKAFRSKRIRNQASINFWSHIGSGGGVEFLWPVILLSILGGSLGELGLIMTLAAFISMILIYFFGKFIDLHTRDESLAIGFGIQAVSDLAKGVLSGIIPPLGLEIGGRFANSVRSSILDVVNYDLTTDNLREDLQDELIVTREMVLDMTAGISCLTIGTVAALWGMNAGMIVGGALGLIGTLVNLRSVAKSQE
jgi:MFS family permease